MFPYLTVGSKSVVLSSQSWSLFALQIANVPLPFQKWVKVRRFKLPNHRQGITNYLAEGNDAVGSRRGPYKLYGREMEEGMGCVGGDGSKGILGVAGTWSSGLQTVGTWNCARDVRFVIRSLKYTMGSAVYAERLLVSTVLLLIKFEQRYVVGPSGSWVDKMSAKWSWD